MWWTIILNSCVGFQISLARNQDKIEVHAVENKNMMFILRARFSFPILLHESNFSFVKPLLQASKKTTREKIKSRPTTDKEDSSIVGPFGEMGKTNLHKNLWLLIGREGVTWYKKRQACWVSRELGCQRSSEVNFQVSFPPPKNKDDNHRK